MAVVLRKDVDRVVLAVYEEQIIKVDTSSVDVRRTTSVDMADAERVGRRGLVQVVEQRRVPVPWLVVERRNKRAVDQLGDVALSHGGTAYVIVDAILAADNKPRFVRQRDDPAGGEVLVFVGGVAVDVAERREPITGPKRTRVPRVPRETNDTLAELVEPKLGMVGAVARHYVDLAVVVDRRGRICHPHAP